MSKVVLDWQDTATNYHDMSIEFRESLLSYIVDECSWARIMLDIEEIRINGQVIEAYQFEIPYTDIRIIFNLNWCIGGVNQVISHDMKSGLGTIIEFCFGNFGEVFVTQTSVDMSPLVNSLKLFDMFKGSIYNRIEGGC